MYLFNRWNLGFVLAAGLILSTAPSCTRDAATMPVAFTPTKTFTPLPTSTATSTSTRTATQTATSTNASTATNTATVTATGTPTNTPTITATSTATSSPTDTATNTSTNSPTNTATSTPMNGGVVTTLAGDGSAGNADATGILASFNNPYGIAVDASGNLYVTDWGSHLIRKIDTGAVVSTLAGTANVSGSTDAVGTAASFFNPDGIAVDASGNLYIGDWNNSLIRGIDTGLAVTTLAGGAGCCAIDGVGTAASFLNPSGVALDSSGNLYIADNSEHLIRKMTPGGAVTTFAGTAGAPGNANGLGTAASFDHPWGIALDSADNVYVADTYNHLIRKIDPAGNVTTFAGSGAPGSTNATGTSASFNWPYDVAVDSSNNVYVADYNNHLIRKITSGGVVTTLAGSGTPGSTNATGTSASFNFPTGVAVDTSGNVYVADSANNLIRKIQ